MGSALVQMSALVKMVTLVAPVDKEASGRD